VDWRLTSSTDTAGTGERPNIAGRLGIRGRIRAEATPSKAVVARMGRTGLRILALRGEVESCIYQVSSKRVNRGTIMSEKSITAKEACKEVKNANETRWKNGL